MYLLLIVFILLLAELVYFRIADRLNIIDKPNQRSSHSIITLRGGGIIFPLSMLGFFLAHGLQYPWFMLGLMLISVVSFADDIRPVPGGIRSLIHAVSVGLLCFQVGYSLLPWYVWLIVFIVMVGTINAWNFMDGINGITVVVSLVTVLTLWYINLQADLFPAGFFLWLLGGLLVFGFFNARPRAKCFAGDIGSVSIAFAILFLLLSLLLHTGSWIYLLLLTVYGMDSVLTIMHRLYKRENIFDAHRQHLYQYLANEAKWPHLKVSAIYGLLQAAINVMVLALAHKSVEVQVTLSAFLLLTLLVCYVWVKAWLIRLAAISQRSA